MLFSLQDDVPASTSLSLPATTQASGPLVHPETTDRSASLAIRHEFLQTIHEELDHLNGLVGNLLDMSRIEAGTLEPRREWHVLEELVEGAIRRVGLPLASRPLQFQLAPDLPPIFVDGLQTQQVLCNLLDNAVKYSPPESPIDLAASLIGSQVEVRVTNRGSGIPAEDLPRIFERFYRAHTGTSRTVPGTGLGLAICKAFVEAHGGRIEAESVPGVLTTLRFRIPVATAGEPAGQLMTERRGNIVNRNQP
jgi:two-component system sensor histidine kinase KdpD